MINVQRDQAVLVIFLYSYITATVTEIN